MIIGSDYMSIQVLCLNITYYANICLILFNAYYAKNYANIFDVDLVVDTEVLCLSESNCVCMYILPTILL